MNYTIKETFTVITGDYWRDIFGKRHAIYKVTPDYITVCSECTSCPQEVTPEAFFKRFTKELTP